MLEHQRAVTHHQHGVHVRLRPGGEPRHQRAELGGVEVDRLRRRDLPAVAKRCWRIAAGDCAAARAGAKSRKTSRVRPERKESAQISDS